MITKDKVDKIVERMWETVETDEDKLELMMACTNIVAQIIVERSANELDAAQGVAAMMKAVLMRITQLYIEKNTEETQEENIDEPKEETKH